MSPEAHVHDANCQRATGAICGPGAVGRYVARLHRRGDQKMRVISRHRSEKAAVKAMAMAFVVAGYWYNFADVIAVEKEPSYYEPRRVCEVRR